MHNWKRRAGAFALAATVAVQGCAGNTSPSDFEEDVTEGKVPGPVEPVILDQMASPSLGIGGFSGVELYRGIVFGDGPVAERIPTIRDHLQLEAQITEPEALAEIRRQITELIAAISEKEPGYFDAFAQEVLSGDHERISRAMGEGAKRARAEADDLGIYDQDSQKCIAVAVILVVAVNVFAIGNHVLAWQSAYAFSADDGFDGMEVEGQQVALMANESVADIAGMTKVSIWEMTDLSYTSLSAYTDPTNHKLVLGDFDGDSSLDRFYYAPGGSADELVATSEGDFIADQGRVGEPFVGDFDGNLVDDILFWEPGNSRHYIWFFEPRDTTPAYTFIRYSSTNTSAQPIVGDFNHDRRDEIFWYVPGSGTDVMWLFAADRSFTTNNASRLQVSGTYVPVVGDFAGGLAEDILWYRPGTGQDHLWVFSNSSTVGTITAYSDIAINGSDYKPFVADFDNNSYDDIFWYRPGSGSDTIWKFKSNAGWAYDGSGVTVNGTYDPVVGEFHAPHDKTIIWWPDR